MRGIDERLHFDQQRPRALLRHQHARTRHALLMLRQKQRRRIRDAAQTALGHREYAEFVHRAEAVLERAHEAERRMRVAFEVQHRIDDVLEHARPGEIALLRHVADHDDGGARLLGDARELRRAFAHLRDRAGRGGQRFGINGLDRIDDGDFGPCSVSIVAWIFSSWISASKLQIGRRVPAAPSRPSRCARNAICAPDSSPLI